MTHQLRFYDKKLRAKPLLNSKISKLTVALPGEVVCSYTELKQKWGSRLALRVTSRANVKLR
jgi:hypothetical protein